MHTPTFYNIFSSLYPLVDILLEPQKDVLLKQVNMLPNGYLLEIGVGNGAHLQKYLRHKIVGIDTSSSMLKIARKHSSPYIELAQMDGTSMKFGNESFDYVVLSHVIAVVDDPEKLMAEVLRVLKPDGKVFILNHFTPHNWLRYIDKAFSLVAKVLHFKSVFHANQVTTLRQFTLLKEISLGSLSYFKLLVYQKPK